MVFDSHYWKRRESYLHVLTNQYQLGGLNILIDSPSLYRAPAEPCQDDRNDGSVSPILTQLQLFAPFYMGF